MGLDLPCGRAAISRLHDESQNCQAYGMAQRAQLLGVSVQFGGHELLLTNSKERATSISSILEIVTSCLDLAPWLTHRYSERRERDHKAALDPANPKHRIGSGGL